MSSVQQFPYRDRNPASGGLDLMPGLPILLRLALAWADSDQVPFLLGQFNFFQAFDVCFFRTRGVFEIGQTGRLGTARIMFGSQGQWNPAVVRALAVTQSVPASCPRGAWAPAAVPFGNPAPGFRGPLSE